MAYSQLNLQEIMAVSPNLRALMERTEHLPNSFILTTCSFLAELWRNKPVPNFPAIVIRSKRIPDDWMESSNAAHFTLDVCDMGYSSSSTYLTWCGPDMSFSISTDDLSEFFSGISSPANIAVLWISDAVITGARFIADDEFLRTWRAAEEAANISRQDMPFWYVDDMIKNYLPLLPGEWRYIGENWKPAYILEKICMNPQDDDDVVACSRAACQEQVLSN